MLITNAHILTCAEKDYDNGYIYIEGKKIKSVGDMTDAPDDNCVIDVAGCVVCPGFIDAHTHLGLCHPSSKYEGMDLNENSDPVTPHIRTLDGIYQADECFDEALEAGVTTLMIGPGSANPIGGTFCTVKTVRGRIDDMAIQAESAMKMAFGEKPKSTYGKGKSCSPVTRQGTAAVIREALFKAKEYMQAKDAGEKPSFNIKHEALIPVLRGEMTVKAHAHRSDDIFTALRIAREFGLKMSIEHCTEGHTVADYLKEEKVPVTVGPVVGCRTKPELAKKSMKTAAELAEKGVCVALISDHPEIPSNLLPFYAALVAREGTGRDKALGMITINAAKLIGMQNRLGSIESGKDADLCILSGHPLDMESKMIMVIVDGKTQKDNRK